MRYLRTVVVVVLSVGIGVFIGMRSIDINHPPFTGVCHSVTEDSAPYDCDYYDNGWHPKN